MKAQISGRVRVLAGCDNCDWQAWKDDTARSDAERHAVKSSHNTWVEIGKVLRYNGSKVKEA